MEHDDKQPGSSYRKRLASLTTHLRKYEKPRPNGYDVYATSYIASDIPWKKILQDDDDDDDQSTCCCYTAELPPFTPKFEIGHLAAQEKERKLRGGESVRKQDILSSSQEIVQHLREACAEIAATRSRSCASDRNRHQHHHLAYLYFKAMQYSQVNKAQALDERYPKSDCDVIRSTYSREHQAAIAATRREQYGSVEAPSLQKERRLVKLPQVLLLLGSASDETRWMAMEREREHLVRLRKAIRETLGSPLITREMKLAEEPWQFKAKSCGEGPKRVEQKSEKKKKRKVPWRKNVYPPKTREEKIAQLRSKAAPLSTEFLETDQLPGYWEPELMITLFKTAGVEDKEKQMEDSVEPEDDWTKIFQTNKKCLDWLKSIPSEL